MNRISMTGEKLGTGNFYLLSPRKWKDQHEMA